MSQTEEEQESRAAAPPLTHEAGAAAVREAAVAYTTRPTRRTPTRSPAPRAATSWAVPVTPAAEAMTVLLWWK
jgi:hypothetical protein